MLTVMATPSAIRSGSSPSRSSRRAWRRRAARHVSSGRRRAYPGSVARVDLAGRLTGSSGLPRHRLHAPDTAKILHERRTRRMMRVAGRVPRNAERTTSDISTAVKFAREHDLLVAVRGAGHNIAGNAVCEGGLMIDLSQMTGVRVDADEKRAFVEPGATPGSGRICRHHSAMPCFLARPPRSAVAPGIYRRLLGPGNASRPW